MGNSGDKDMKNIQLVCIYSLPRSGSTALVAQFERYEGILCLPESYFPQLYEMLDSADRRDPDRLAALYLASSPDGCLLTFREVRDCFRTLDYRESLIEIGLRYAEKIGRDLAQVRAVVWKTTRLVGAYKRFAAAGGVFILLRRDSINIFDSQFRVGFGIHNRRPLRFMAFRESYEAVFAKLPKSQTKELVYKDIPERVPIVVKELGCSGRYWGCGSSALGATSGRQGWHREVMGQFENRDRLKADNVTGRDRWLLGLGQVIFRPLRPFLGMARNYFDRKIMLQVYQAADQYDGKV